MRGWLQKPPGSLPLFSAIPDPTFSHPTFYYPTVWRTVVFDITMSFGFSIGDFITVIELASKIRKGFVDAPSQFNAISDEYATLATIFSTTNAIDGTESEAFQLSSLMSKLSSLIANSLKNKR